MQTTCFKTYRSESWCIPVKNLLLVLPATAAASAPPRRIGSVCAVGGSLVIRLVSIGATSGRLRGLRTKEGGVSSSSSPSSAILTSRRHFGAWLVSAGIASVGDGSTTVGLFPAALSSMVGTGRVWSSSLLVYWRHRAPSPAGGSTLAGWSIPGASDTYTEHRSTSPIWNTIATSHQSKGYRIHVAIQINKGILSPWGLVGLA